jgi:RecJ-like exonuclease
MTEHKINGSSTTEHCRIVCCGTCTGSGIVEKGEMTSYHNRDYEYWKESCPHCDGEGRVVVYEVELSVNVTLTGYTTATLREKFTRREKLQGRTPAEIYKIGSR